MTTTSIQEQIDELFADDPRMHSQAVERLEQGDIRDAAEMPGAPPNAPLTPCCWPARASNRAYWSHR